MGDYICMRPTRLDRDYAVGEAIAAGAVDPRMAGSLIGWGKIRRAEKGPPVAPNAAKFACPACGRACGSRQALAAHERSHGAGAGQGGGGA